MNAHETDVLLSSLADRTRDELPAGRIGLAIDDRIVGSVLRHDAKLIAGRVQGVTLDDESLAVLPVCADDASSVLAAIARTLRDAGRCGRWRNELLPVTADDATVLAAIERGCARVLGIRTFAVHLVGATAPGQPEGLWLQRRAPDKDVDPGLLDTLAGGLVGMQPQGRQMESFLPALEREVHEEAGLLAGQYTQPFHIGTWRSRRQLADGFMVEDMLVYRARLAPDAIPANRDGEVSEFLRVNRQDLLARIANGQLTLAASIAMLLTLRHESAPGPTAGR